MPPLITSLFLVHVSPQSVDRQKPPVRPASSMHPIGLAYNLKTPFAMDRVVALLSDHEKSYLYEAQISPGTETEADLTRGLTSPLAMMIRPFHETGTVVT